MTAAEAYEPPPPNDWARPWARVVLFTLIGMGVAGWLAAEGGWLLKMGMCALTLVIEVWGYLAAVQWSRALARKGVPAPLGYWTIEIVGCSAWTVFSIYHAIKMIAGDGAA
jgi:hypothetical protein